MKALADIPPELLAVAVNHAIASNPYFPKPAELRASIAEELGHHRRKLEEARLAALPKPQPPTPVTDEDIVYVDDIVKKTLQVIAGRRDIIQGDDNQ